MNSVSVSIDVPDLDEGVSFYEDAFGFSEVSRPVAGVVVLRIGDAEICLLEKPAGTRASSRTEESRHYSRHWTPIHLDIHVDEFGTALAKALAAGAICEDVQGNPKHGSVAFCSDPFGHGFCIIERRAA